MKNYFICLGLLLVVMVFSSCTNSTINNNKEKITDSVNDFEYKDSENQKNSNEISDFISPVYSFSAHQKTEDSFDHMLDICIEMPDELIFETVDIYINNSTIKLYSEMYFGNNISISLIDIPHNEKVELCFKFFDLDGKLICSHVYKNIYIYDNKGVNSQQDEKMLNYMKENNDIKTIIFYSAISDEEFEILLSIDGLEYVIFRENVPNNIQVLEKYENLRGLSISDTNFSDFSKLKNLNKLELLDIKNTQIKDISAINSFSQLKKLYASNTTISNINALSELSLLNDLYFNGTNISDISSLANLVNVRILDISDTQVINIDYIDKMSELQNLDISNTKITCINALRDIKKIQRLNITNTLISDLSPLEDTSEMVSLYISNTEISDLKPIGKNVNMQILLADDTYVNNVLSLENMNELERLWLGGSDIVSIEGIEKLESLEELLLCDTRIASILPIQHLNNLRWLTLIRCEIDNDWREFVPSGCSASYSN